MKVSLFLTYALGSVLALGQSYKFKTTVTPPKAPARIVVNPLPKRADGTTPYRLEIRDLKANKYRWNIFMLSMSVFMSVDQSNPLSYYQIAGIHGAPFTTYNNVQPFARGVQAGYCAHNSLLFPTWHRPYLILYETQLYNIANQIANQFTDANERKLYKAAAADFRIPYWDWSRYAPAGQTDHFPKVFGMKTVQQNGPNGIQTISNPLYSYIFHPLDSNALVISPLNQWPETKRAPNTALKNPTSDNSQVNAAMLARTPQIQQRLYNLFSGYKDYNSFSNKAYAFEHNSNADSIESVHDLVHVYTGLNGHMTYVPLSAFDPLFFFHHVNTDRLIAMWQVVNPNSWMSSLPSAEDSYSYRQGTSQNSKSPLYPFSSSAAGSFWTSDMSRNTESMGYTYADTDAKTANLRANLIKKINSWYGGQSPANLQTKKRQVDHLLERSNKEARKLQSAGSFYVKPDAKGPRKSQVVKNNHYTEWTANVLVGIEALDGVFTVNIFVGAPPTNYDTWNTTANLIGTAAILNMNRDTGSDVKVSAAVPLTAAMLKLVAAGDIASLDPKDALPFLKEQLQFTVLGSDNKPVNQNIVDGLQIDVQSADVEVPASDTELPIWGLSLPRLNLKTSGNTAA